MLDIDKLEEIDELDLTIEGQNYDEVIKKHKKTIEKMLQEFKSKHLITKY